MKLVEIKLNEEMMGYRDMQYLVYDFILDSVLLGPDWVKEDFKELSRQTDQFWAEEFDTLHTAIESGEWAERAAEAFVDTIYEIVDNIENYYGNPMNHPPGYEKPKLKINNRFEYYGDRSKEVLKFIKQVNPEFYFDW